MTVRIAKNSSSIGRPRLEKTALTGGRFFGQLFAHRGRPSDEEKPGILEHSAKQTEESRQHKVADEEATRNHRYPKPATAHGTGTRDVQRHEQE